MAIHFYTSSTLDGFLATDDDSLDWLFSFAIDLEGPMAYPAFVDNIGALVMGASTYDWLIAHEKAWPYTQPTWVFTHRPRRAPEGAAIRFIEGSPHKHIDAIRQSAREKDIWIVGGGALATRWAKEGLLDEVWIQYAPITLGHGKPLATDELNLELLDVQRNRDFVCTRYTVRHNSI
ncbi:dihydrofolate reductase family protein [Arcanobacterium haemolyticum]|nr:dihydrofolate reductase family protein [Arcanobacterium haemolyticum]